MRVLVLPRSRHGAGFGVFALSITGAVGLALIIIGLGGATGWSLIAPGFAGVLVSLPGIYLLRRCEIEEASKTTGRSRAVTFRRERPE